MSDKKYYWLKLDRNFFKRHDIRIIEELPNGKDYVLFYLKLLVESIDHEGNLRFSETIPYKESMLATITNTNIDIVRAAMNAFTELGMIEILDDATIFMTEIQKMIGNTSDDQKREQARARQQRRRAKLKSSHADVTQVSRKCVTGVTQVSLEKEIEIEKEIEKEEDRTNANISVVLKLWNSMKNTINIQEITPMTKRWNETNICLKLLGVDRTLEALEKIKDSEYLQGRDKRLRFDNFINVDVLQKALEGNYDKKFTEKKDHGFQEHGYDWKQIEDKMTNKPAEDLSQSNEDFVLSALNGLED